MSTSTGPRTPAGKDRAKMNAVKHGFSGRTLLVAADEQLEYQEFIAEWEQDLDPFGAPEKELFGVIVEAAWKLRRLSRAEAGLLDESLGSPDPLTVAAVAIQNQLRLFSIYQQRAERSLFRAMNELRKLQEERLFRAEALPAEVELPALLPRTAVIRREIVRDKRTQQALDAAASAALLSRIDAIPAGSPAPGQTNPPPCR